MRGCAGGELVAILVCADNTNPLFKKKDFYENIPNVQYYVSFRGTPQVFNIYMPKEVTTMIINPANL